ncbi:hypothetical protein QBC42DRAFT_294802 [Cladorrhinum samala]|uniref:Uncharacterized protein n=1 Tax=Cladorrhinum samala TaxID=585594 RepID=A0AAV9HYC8_9PEZI|nr:hypothetical protein QBC42DRAFT_294802 [Cladorrhinum samala]
MKTAQQLLLLAGSGLTAALPGSSGRSLAKRSDYDVCDDNCALRGVAMPDENNFKLPLEGDRSEQCPPVYIGCDPEDPEATGRVCLDFQGPSLRFTHAMIPGFTYKSFEILWKVKEFAAGYQVASCAPGGDGFTCEVPFSTILGVSPSQGLEAIMAGMCPKGDREALTFDLQISGEVVSNSDETETSLTLQEQYPCTSRTDNGQCTAWNTDVDLDHTEVAYRCTKCEPKGETCQTTTATSTSNSVSPTSNSNSNSTSTTEPPTSSTSSTSTTTSSSTSTSPPPTLKTCGFGTAFGYQNPVGGVPKSTTLNTQSGAGCNRWGWYETPTVAELQGGISGPLYVGAGGNDITKAVDVGVWVATANAQGGVTVTYLLNPPYALAEAHVNLACLPITKCAPGQYTYNAGAIPNLPTWSNPTPLTYPTCTGGSRAALIVHAAVNILSVTSTCPAPKAS